MKSTHRISLAIFLIALSPLAIQASFAGQGNSIAIEKARARITEPLNTGDTAMHSGAQGTVSEFRYEGASAAMTQVRKKLISKGEYQTHLRQEKEKDTDRIGHNPDW